MTSTIPGSSRTGAETTGGATTCESSAASSTRASSGSSIEGREAFSREHEHQYAHHLYVCANDSTAYKNHVLLRKHLMETPDAFRRYEDLKIRLAESGLDRESYTREKTFLILEFLRAEGLSIEELEDIKTQNLV